MEYMTVYDLNGAKIVSTSGGGGFEQTPTPNRIQFNSIQFNSIQFNSILQFNPILKDIAETAKCEPQRTPQQTAGFLYFFISFFFLFFF